MDPHLSQQTVGLQHTVLQLEQYVTRPTAIFRPTLPKKSEVDGEQCDQIWRFFCTLGNYSKLVATIILSKLLTLLGNFCKGVKIINFSSEFIFGQLL